MLWSYCLTQFALILNDSPAGFPNVKSFHVSFFSDFFKALKKVLGNQMYFVLLCVSLLHFSSFIGFLTYSPKYLEQQYGQSTSQSNFFTGECLPPSCVPSGHKSTWSIRHCHHLQVYLSSPSAKGKQAALGPPLPRAALSVSQDTPPLWVNSV